MRYRIEWTPGTDLLRGMCSCGAARDFEDPVTLWNWLLGHWLLGHEDGKAEDIA